MNFYVIYSSFFALDFALKIALPFNMATRTLATISVVSAGNRK